MRGLRAVVSRERNARIHIVFAVMALIASLLLRIDLGGVALISAMIALVFFAEVINTAIERTLDLIATENNQIVKLVKDMTAGAVLVTASAAVLVAICVFGPPIFRLLGY
ncbi:diacylglycerol kinase family protein [Candidatus Saccharibacteria bacterium]|nr:diacylglycerol kinase family protein [Candidatus Saccharibacteria bacterium]